MAWAWAWVWTGSVSGIGHVNALCWSLCAILVCAVSHFVIRLLYEFRDTAVAAVQEFNAPTIAQQHKPIAISFHRIYCVRIVMEWRRILSADRFHHNFCHFWRAQFLRTVIHCLGYASELNRIGHIERIIWLLFIFACSCKKRHPLAASSIDGKEAAGHAMNLMHANSAADGRLSYKYMSIWSMVVQSAIGAAAWLKRGWRVKNFDRKKALIDSIHRREPFISHDSTEFAMLILFRTFFLFESQPYT